MEPTVNSKTSEQSSNVETEATALLEKRRRQRSKGKAKVASSSFTAAEMERPESFRKKKKRAKGKDDGASSLAAAAAVVAAPPQQDAAAAEPFGRWPELHEELLAAIVGRLPSLRDVSATASVCRAWRSFVRSSCPHAGRPPLLVRPILRLVDPIPNRRRRGRRSSPWIDPRRCELLCPAAGPSVLPVPALVSSEALSHRFLGVAHGHIIFISDAERLVIVVDPFSGVEVRPPRLPSNVVKKFNLGTLTAPTPSPDCKLVLSADSSVFFLWAVGTENWTIHSLRAAEVMNQRISIFWDIIQIHDQIFAFDIHRRLFAVSFSPELGITQLPVRWEGPGPGGMIDGHQFPVECAGELMLVQVAPTGVPIHWCFIVNRLDRSSQPPAWRKVDDLGDWSLFVDSRRAVACESPGRWGGRTNCVYYVGRGCDTWYVFPLSDGGIIDVIDPDGPLHRSKAELPLWPSALWLYPTNF